MKENAIKLTFLYCNNSLTPQESSQCVKEVKDIELNMIGVPCSGKVNIQYLLKAIETGSDALILATCMFGECKYVQGNVRAQKRVEAVDALLVESGFEKGRVKHLQITSNDKIKNIVLTLNEMTKQIKAESHVVKEKV